MLPVWKAVSLMSTADTNHTMPLRTGPVVKRVPPHVISEKQNYERETLLLRHELVVGKEKAQSFWTLRAASVSHNKVDVGWHEAFEDIHTESSMSALCKTEYWSNLFAPVDISTGHFCAKANCSSRETIKVRGRISGIIVPAVPERTTETVTCCVSFPGWAATKRENQKLSADTRHFQPPSLSEISLVMLWRRCAE